ncbi:MAG: hypothetical protein ABIH49_01535 [archaeon]
MAGENDYRGDYAEYQQYPNMSNIKMRDMEEKQNILKERLLLIGQNLIETKEIMSEKILELKKDLEDMKNEMEKMKSFLETFSSEVSKFAKKDDLEILQKQAKMFQPLDFVRKSELKKHFKEN